MTTENTVNFDPQRYRSLVELMPHEAVSSATIGPVAGHEQLLELVITPADERKPVVLGPQTLLNIRQALAQGEELVAGEHSSRALLVRTAGPAFVAGADLSIARQLHTTEESGLVAELGQVVMNAIEDFPLTSIALVHGAAIGGGLELALACDYRVAASGVKNLSVPEVFLGLIPGWGGVHRLPALLGAETAAELIISRPLQNNKTTSAAEALSLGLVDEVVDAAGEDFYAAALEWVSGTLDTLEHPRQLAHRGQALNAEQAAGLQQVIDQRTGGLTPAPARALAQLVHVPADREDACQAQRDDLAELILTSEFRFTVYSYMELLQKRAKRPAGVPQGVNGRKIQKVGIIGAGLMASQLAVVFAQQLQVPVHLTDLQEEALERGLGFAHSQLDKLVSRGRLSEEAAAGLKELITGSTDQQDFADADFVIEAIFEQLDVKQKALSAVEKIVSPECILATNTSSLSVTAMAEVLQQPQRLIGFHFFNPVSSMPLIEIVRTEHTDDAAVATAFQLAQQLRKTPILVKDATAFVVNRVLLRLLCEVLRAFDAGTDAHTADEAMDRLGLPMSPFDLLALVGLPVAQHVAESLAESFGPRFHVSENIQRLIDHQVKSIWAPAEAGGTTEKKVLAEDAARLLECGNEPLDSQAVYEQVMCALAEEIGLLLAEEVVAGPEDVDLAMILGAGWPLFRGGITPFLDAEGFSEKVLGRRLNPAVSGEGAAEN